MALEKHWDMYYQRDRPAPAAFYRPHYILPIQVAYLHGKRDSGEAFKDGVMSFVCSENGEFENLLDDPKHQIVRSDFKG